ncbi:hypothetical protein Pint_13330 [Pistacia integerrima]|uniref:Uncharacterized protein n=1 Tax=Pistacia integerrima TaxID=434235 RepID=A0ACC0YAA7_9ROSI|nr:hypothetical protein Pint_13330 [Pistacia integerrima]
MISFPLSFTRGPKEALSLSLRICCSVHIRIWLCYINVNKSLIALQEHSKG